MLHEMLWRVAEGRAEGGIEGNAWACVCVLYH